MDVKRIEPEVLFAAFKMPPEAAVAYLQAKGLKVSESWRDVWKEAHQTAFTVARSAGFDVLADIKKALVEALNNGENWEQFSRRITPTLQQKGWWGKAIDPDSGEIKPSNPKTGTPVEYGSPRRLRLIFEQNAQTAFMAGRYQTFSSATKTHPYWQYLALMDTRTRPSHKAMHQRTFKFDDPAWEVAKPPNGWRCRCRFRAMSLAAVQREGIEVQSAKGHIEVVKVPRLDGSFDTVKRIKLPGMQQPFQPDVGFDYAPY